MAMIQVDLVKAKGKHVMVDSEKITDQGMYEYIFALGLREIVAKRGRSKYKGEDFASDPELDIRIAEEMIQQVYDAKVKRVGVKSTKGAKRSPEHVEARRLCLIAAKQTIKDAGLKISHYPPAQIKEVAEAIFNSDPDTYLAAARANLAKANEAAAAKPKIDLASMLSVDAEKIAKAKEKAAAAKAKKAAEKEPAAPQRPVPPQRPQARPQARH